MKNTTAKNKGFTLIELLIVLAIIGVLTGLLLANFIGVRERARDAQRKSDVKQIQTALELYRQDNGTYPIADVNAHTTQNDYPVWCGVDGNGNPFQILKSPGGAVYI